METIRYPLLFNPLFEEGDGQDQLLRQYLGDKGPTAGSPKGCMWGLIDAEDRASVVANGPLAGTSIRTLVVENAHDLIGKRQRVDQFFPMCVRVLETAVDCPLGVFPEGTGGSATRGKTSNYRFWYSLGSREGAILISGIRPGATRMDLIQNLNTPSLRECLQVYRPEPYSSFFAPSGRVHALGAGNLLVEIQQRLGKPISVSGWGTSDAVPLPEAEAALELVNIHDRQIRRIAMDVGPMLQTRRVPLVAACPAFHIDEIRLCDHLYGRTTGETFHLFVVVDGQVTVQVREQVWAVAKGQTVLIPACLGDYRLAIAKGNARLLKACLP